MALDIGANFTPRVLVIDDEERIRDVCHKLLTQEGCRVERAANGQAGIEFIEREHFDIILLDLMMPGLTGFDVLERVRGLHPDTVIIVITGYATIDYTIEAMKKGAFDFIPKPFSPQDLRLAVSKALYYIRTLQDIAQERSRMRVLVNYLMDGVLAVDIEKKVALANPAFMRMFGRANEDAQDRPLAEAIPNETLGQMIDQALQASPDELVEVGEEFQVGEVADERTLWARSVPFRDRVGRNLGAVTVVHDVTDARLRDKLKSDFVSMVAHEIRTPMNTVLLQLKVLLDGLAGDLTEKQTEILSRSTERINALVNLSNELLDLSRIESGLIAHEKEMVNLNEIITSQADFQREYAREKGIDLQLESLPDLPPLLANRQNLEEVLSNLITNAIKYTPEGGRVTVSAEADANTVRFRVADTGFGLSPEDQQRIFDRFYRVKNDKTRRIAGTGLGLPIVKRIVEAHQGWIDVASAPDEGSTFQVNLPIHPK